jgi:flagellar basal-body rod modification protein FlgD
MSTTTNPLNDLTGYTAAQQAADAKAKTESTNTLGKDDFFKLLIAQLKNQDPLNPTDGTQFAAQLAQYSSLEQLQNMNTNLSTSINANYTLSQSINNTMAATLIGKEVKLSGGTFSYSGEESVKLGYTINSAAKDLTIKIYDSKGTLVQTIKKSDVDAGTNYETWDFKNSIGGTVSKGTYKFEVEATANSGDALTPEIFKYGTIAGVRYTDNGTKLLIGLSTYELSDISEILNPGK